MKSIFKLAVVALPIMLIGLRLPHLEFDQRGVTTSQPPSTQAPTPPPTPPAQAPTEPEILQAQLDTMRQYDQKLIDTVYWSLGTIAGLAVLVAGFSWFSNFRLYQRDRDALRDELSSLLASKAAETRQENRTALREIHDRVAASIDEAVASKTSSLDRKLEWLRSEVMRLRIDQYTLEAELWEMKGITSNALTYYTRALAGSIDIGSSGAYSDLLSAIIRVLTQRSYVTSWDSSSLNAAIAQLPAEYEAEVARIKELLSTKLTG